MIDDLVSQGQRSRQGVRHTKNELVGAYLLNGSRSLGVMGCWGAKTLDDGFDGSVFK